MKFKRKSYAILVIAVLCFFSGIVITGCATSGKGKFSSQERSKKAVKVDRKWYLPLDALCEEFNFSWEWDGFSRIITLKKSGLDFRIYPGSAMILLNNQVENLDAPVQVYQGMIIVPESFMRFFAAEKKSITPPERKSAEYSIRKIVIDAGHGGKDPGAIGFGIQEKDINLDISRRLKAELEKSGIKVLLTRETDIFHPLEKRAEIANNARADFFISIHTNAAGTAGVSGFEAYYLSADYDDFSKAVQMRENAAVSFEGAPAAASNKLNATLWDMMLSENRVESIEMANTIARGLNNILKLKTRHVSGAMFYVLKGASMPAILLEVGYLSNPSEAAHLNNGYYRQMLAEAIAAGILSYKQEFELNNGFSR